MLYDDRGNVVAVMKISPEKLPSHRYVAIPSRVTLVHRGGGCMAHLKGNKKIC